MHAVCCSGADIRDHVLVFCVKPHVQVQGDVWRGVLVNGEGCAGVKDCSIHQKRHKEF